MTIPVNNQRSQGVSFFKAQPKQESEKPESQQKTTTAKKEGSADTMQQLAWLGLQNQANITPKKPLSFDPSLLDAQMSQLDPSTQKGLSALSNPKTLAMFNAFSGQLKGSPAQNLETQNAFLSELG